MWRPVLLPVVSLFLLWAFQNNDSPLSAEAVGFPALLGRQAPGAPSLAFVEVINNASLLFANQLVGSATSVAELVYLCNNFDTSRLATQGYNVTLIKDRICASSQLPALESDSSIKNLTILYSTDIWVTQANATVQGDYFLLCDFISVLAADSVGLNGTLLELALQCTLPNDGGPLTPTPTTTTTPATTTSTTTSRATLHKRAAYYLPQGSPAPVHSYNPSLSIHILATPAAEARDAYVIPAASPKPTFDKRIQPQHSQPTTSTTYHSIHGKPSVTQLADVPHSTPRV